VTPDVAKKVVQMLQSMQWDFAYTVKEAKALRDNQEMSEGAKNKINRTIAALQKALTAVSKAG
jgi:hypothetical protein